MPTQPELTFDPHCDFLAEVYQTLGYADGDLQVSRDRPIVDEDPHWLEKGDWLALAKSAGAERIFFVDNNPVVVFARAQVDGGFPAVRRLYNRIWSMSRPRLLFIETPGELSLYDLAKAPVHHAADLEDDQRCLQRIRSITDVTNVLQKFRREEIESGRIFGDKRFGSLDFRADKSLIQDLKAVRARLLKSGLEPRFAHALIGRAIFVRYLEDRQILVGEYFVQVAKQRQQWLETLLMSSKKRDVDKDLDHLLFPRVLGDKEFTYALFEQLAIDFHGDMFPFNIEEKANVTRDHLLLLQGLLRGEVTSQLQLFFFAYKFDIIPIELISSIYEEFYNDEQGKGKNQGSHYTPSSLVEFLLNQVLCEDVLSRSPRILDPACGSGIFLVESFRRIVRYKTRELGKRLRQDQLKKILREQIAGIDINEEAIRIAAFSLYLALLHYQEPREINDSRRLPGLKWERERKTDERNYFDILLNANAFKLTADKLNDSICRKFADGSFDVVLGNPPWGAPQDKDIKGLAEAKIAYEWCSERNLPLGDKELSQAFIYRVRELLREGGQAGMLVSSGILWKEHAQSVQFRQQWLRSTRIKRVVNFAHVRRIFFSGSMREAEGIAPFISVHFSKELIREPDAYFEYWSAKRTQIIQQLQVAVLDRTDLRLLNQQRCLRNDKLWKIYWWGNQYDESLIQSLKSHTALQDIADKKGAILIGSGSGFKETGGTKDKRHGWKMEFLELPTRSVKSYGRLNRAILAQPPPKVARVRDVELFKGKRIIIKQCPSGNAGQIKRIIARYETQPFCYRHSIYTLKFRGDLDWEIKIVLGILWSSVARYYFFLTASQWGSWYDKFSLDDLRGLPVRLPGSKRLRDRIVKYVDALRNWRYGSNTMHPPELLQQDYAKEEAALERKLDQAIFALFEFSEVERDLVWDMCDVGLDLYYRHMASEAFQPLALPICRQGTISDANQIDSKIGRYLFTFLETWNREVEPDQEFTFQLISNSNETMVAIVFDLHNRPVQNLSRASLAWSAFLDSIERSSLSPWLSRRIYIDGCARIVSDSRIVLIKRNELRFWTRTVAREDAEATLVQFLNSEENE